MESLDAEALGPQAVCVLVEVSRLWDLPTFRHLVLLLISKYRYFKMQNELFREDWFCLGFTASVFRVHSCGTNVGNFMILFDFKECGPQYLSPKRKDSIHLQFKILENWLLIDYCLCLLQQIPFCFFL